jgi:acetyl-CoA C-acetyltransferase
MDREVVIASGIRTAIRDFGGALSGTPPCELATAVARETIVRSGIDAGKIG